jgi:hypothetical protein
LLSYTSLHGHPTLKNIYTTRIDASRSDNTELTTT